MRLRDRAERRVFSCTRVPGACRQSDRWQFYALPAVATTPAGGGKRAQRVKLLSPRPGLVLISQGPGDVCLFAGDRAHRVDTRGLERGDRARGQRDKAEHRSHGAEDARIERLNTEKQ